MKRAEAESLAHLTGQAARGVTRIAQDTQNAVTDRVYERLTPRIGPVAGPIHTIHRALTQHAYFWVHAGLEAAALAARMVTAARASGIGSISDRPRGHATLAVVNGIRGDHLHREGSPLALPMTLRHAGRDVAADAGSLRTAYGRGHTRLAVFVHGLVETEDSWQYRSSARWGSAGVSYGSRLHADLGYLPIWLRYNTGRTLAANGAALAALLTRLVRGLARDGGGARPRRALDGWAGHPQRPGAVRRGRVAAGAGRHHPGQPAPRRPPRAPCRRGRSGAPDPVPAARWASGILRLRSEGIKDLRGDAATHEPQPAADGRPVCRAVHDHAAGDLRWSAPASATGSCRCQPGIPSTPPSWAGCITSTCSTTPASTNASRPGSLQHLPQ